MKPCGICNNSFNEEDLTTVTPAQYLGDAFPEITSFCPECFQKFLVKAQAHIKDIEESKNNSLKVFTES